MKFYICDHCKKIITVLNESGVPVMCCGQKMTELVPGTVDAAVEKHVPVCEADDDMVTVTVGEVEHPMLEEHSIQWIALETANGCQIKHLKPGEKPVANFAILDDDEVVAVYEYCNLHGLWKA